MTGRTVHDGLLRLLTSAALRARLDDGDGALAAALGAAEARALAAADRDRLRRLARFMGRHFYRERVVRLFAASRKLAIARGTRDPLDVVAGEAFGAVLDTAEVGSAETADRVASLVEARLAAALADLAYGGDLVAYEGALFRAEAGPRRWDAASAAGTLPVRSPHARLCALDWDVTPLVAAVRRGDASLPEPANQPTRLLVALATNGRVTTVRCATTIERLLAALDGERTAAQAAASAGVPEEDAGRVLRQLTEVGAVEWRAAAAAPTSSPRSSSRSSST